MEFPFELRPEQKKNLRELELHDHLIMIAPTGSGKSLIFQKYIFDRLSKTRAMFISPLNALSRQQELRFLKLGIPAHFRRIPSQNENGVWLLSPESIKKNLNPWILDWRPNFLIVDEAHCVWEWGLKFRPSYERILDLPAEFSIPKSIWCSATLPVSLQNNLITKLVSTGGTIKQTGTFEFPKSLTLKKEKISPENRLCWLKNRIENFSAKSGMVFCNTRASAERLQLYLEKWGIHSFYYHAGLSLEEKLNLEKKLSMHEKNHQPVVVVATSAFGMGMDYSFFKFCILFEPPFTLLSLVQAVGRVSRTRSYENRAIQEAVVLWHESDFSRYPLWINQEEVMKWCKSMENPMHELEKYFNGVPSSGRMIEYGKPSDFTFRSQSAH